MKKILSRYNRIFSRFFTGKQVAFLLIILFIGIFVFFVTSGLFAIKNISCKTQYGPCVGNNEETLKEFYGKNLFLLNSNKVRRKEESIFSNRRVFVQKVFPNTLSVVIEKRKPLAGVSVGIDKKGVFLVDSDGKVIGFSNISELPTVVIDQTNWKTAVGQEVADDTLKALQILNLLYKSQSMSSAHIEGNTLVVDLTSGSRVYLPQDRDPQVLVGALQLILVRSKIDDKIPKTIDLRYSNPVLRY